MYNTTITRKHFEGTSTKTGKHYAFDKFYVTAETPIGTLTVEVKPADPASASTLALIVPEDDEVP